MIKNYSLYAVFGILLCASTSFAQLPANPWVPQAPSPNDGYFGEDIGNSTQGSDVVNAPIYNQGPTGGDILPVDPWARARDRSGVRTWRGSGQHGKLNYIGEATTYTTASGQEMIAPEVNRHNMIVMLDHLRNMGYMIPESYNDKIKTMPIEYKETLTQAMSDVTDNSGDDPLSLMFTNVYNIFQDYSGLDFNNILMNTMDILSTD
ncbi:MAG: hypothetical protein E7016_05325 [Alphaproteobacteria bacterium]|nr:hypothetical protein [Alphaproteobacteria bacterium]